MDEISKIKDAVDLCNQRDILVREVEEYRESVNLELPTVKEYKKACFAEDAPRHLMMIVCGLVGIFFGMLLVFNEVDFGIWIFFLGPFVLYKLVFKTIWMLMHKSDFNEYAQLLQEYEQEKPNLIQLLKESKEKLDNFEEHMDNEDVCIIPRKYWDNANIIYGLIKNKRATDLVSAINKFEDIMHQMRMESMTKEARDFQEIAAYNSAIAAENSAIAAENSRVAAVNSGVSAVFSIANYLKD